MNVPRTLNRFPRSPVLSRPPRAVLSYVAETMAAASVGSFSNGQIKSAHSRRRLFFFKGLASSRGTFSFEKLRSRQLHVCPGRLSSERTKKSFPASLFSSSLSKFCYCCRPVRPSGENRMRPSPSQPIAKLLPLRGEVPSVLLDD